MSISQLSLRDVTRRYDDHVVLDRVSLTVRPGEKVGVVGDNGAGKSTLLRLLAGVEPADDGELAVVAPGGVGYLPQTLDVPPGATVQDAVDAALGELRALEHRIRSAEQRLAQASGDALEAALAAYSGLVEAYEARAGADAELRVDIALHAVGLPGLDRGRRLESMSGGERSRLGLAATLASNPELLLLDEPTNDLDDQALEWLEEHLRQHRGTVVAVTHDRVFLDHLTTVVVEVGDGRVQRHGNGYAGYLTAKAAERRRHLLAYDTWRAELSRHEQLLANNAARLEAVPRKVDKPGFGHGAFRARGRDHGAMSRIRNAKERVERLEENPVAPPPEPMRFAPQLVRGTSGEGAAVVLDDVRVHGRLGPLELSVAPGERLLVTGPNGAGKTTLMRLVAGELQPDGGSVRVAGSVGHLRQEQAPWPPRTSMLRAFAGGRAGSPREHADRLLSVGLFTPEQLRLRVGQLSHGQRRRLELAQLVTEPVDVLLLDEPTNHLSPALVEELEQALDSYTGTVILVSHDRRLRSRFTGSVLELDAGRVASRSGASPASP
jgi:macrolide transport system ATP-binding/permease protein